MKRLIIIIFLLSLNSLTRTMEVETPKNIIKSNETNFTKKIDQICSEEDFRSLQNLLLNLYENLEFISAEEALFCLILKTEYLWSAEEIKIKENEESLVNDVKDLNTTFTKFLPKILSKKRFLNSQLLTNIAGCWNRSLIKLLIQYNIINKTDFGLFEELYKEKIAHLRVFVITSDLDELITCLPSHNFKKILDLLEMHNHKIADKILEQNIKICCNRLIFLTEIITSISQPLIHDSNTNLGTFGIYV